MNVWGVIFIGLQIAAVFGPLPNAEICAKTATAQNFDWAIRRQEGTDLSGNPLTDEMRQMWNGCLFQEERPETNWQPEALK